MTLLHRAGLGKGSAAVCRDQLGAVRMRRLRSTAVSDPFAALMDLPGIADAVTASREAVDGLLGHRVLRRRSAEVTA